MKRLAVLMLVAFVDMMGLMIIWPLLPLYAKNLGGSATIVGLLAASFPVAQLVSSPVWGYVSDRSGRRPALLVGLGASAFAYLVFGFAHSVWLLFLSRFVQGLGGGTTGVVQAYVADSMLPRERAKALGWLSAATSAGVLFGPGLGSFLNHFGYAVPGVFASILVLVNVAFAWKWLPESRWTQAGVTRTGTEKPLGSITLRDAVRNIVQPAVRVFAEPSRPVSLLIWIYAFAMLAFNALPPVFSLYLNDRFAITTEQIGYFFMVFGAIGVLMRIGPVGWFNDKIGEVRTMQVGTLLLFAGFILVPLAATLPLFIAAQVLLPLGTALLFPANSALVSHKAHHDQIGVTLGVQQTYRGVAAILGPIYAGASYQLLGQHVPFFISALITVFVLYLTLRIREDTPTPVAVST